MPYNTLGLEQGATNAKVEKCISQPFNDREEYESGVCSETGEKHNWSYVRRSVFSHYIYECPDCKKVVYVYHHGQF